MPGMSSVRPLFTMAYPARESADVAQDNAQPNAAIDNENLTCMRRSEWRGFQRAIIP